MKPLPAIKIDEIAKKSNNYVELVVNLYLYAVDKFESAQSIIGYPIISMNTFSYIAAHVKWDEKASFNMLWLQKGFTVVNDMEDFCIDLDRVKTN